MTESAVLGTPSLAEAQVRRRLRHEDVDLRSGRRLWRDEVGKAPERVGDGLSVRNVRNPAEYVLGISFQISGGLCLVVVAVALRSPHAIGRLRADKCIWTLHGHALSRRRNWGGLVKQAGMWANLARPMPKLIHNFVLIPPWRKPFWYISEARSIYTIAALQPCHFDGATILNFACCMCGSVG